MGSENSIDSTIHKKRNNNLQTILCIAEANAIPPRMWLHVIKAVPEVKTSRNSLV